MTRFAGTLMSVTWEPHAICVIGYDYAAAPPPAIQSVEGGHDYDKRKKQMARDVGPTICFFNGRVHLVVEFFNGWKPPANHSSGSRN